MKKHTINPQLAKMANVLYPNLLYPTTEYQKENLTETSYIFAPNHTNNLDGYLIWSLLAKDYDMDTFMYKEFWDNFPLIAKVLPLFNVYPITRDKVQPKEIGTELKKLKDKDHSLVIFPQGRHVDPELMLKYPDHHMKTIPLGAFYIAAKSGKSIVPIFMEPQILRKDNAVIYGKPISPKDFSLPQRGKINQESLLSFAREWLDEMNRLYQSAEDLTGRVMHPYQIELAYTDASGLRYGKLNDPNRIMRYKEQLDLLQQIHNETGITNIEELCTLAGVSEEATTQISQVQKVYQKCLVKHN